MSPGSRGRRRCARSRIEKLLGTGFGGNAFTAHGRLREPEIAHWARRVYGMQAEQRAVPRRRPPRAPRHPRRPARARRIARAVRDQDHRTRRGGHPAPLPAAGLVAAVRARRRAHARRLGAARRLRARRHATPSAAGSTGTTTRSTGWSAWRTSFSTPCGAEPQRQPPARPRTPRPTRARSSSRRNSKRLPSVASKWNSDISPPAPAIAATAIADDQREARQRADARPRTRTAGSPSSRPRTRARRTRVCTKSCKVNVAPYRQRAAVGAGHLRVDEEEGARHAERDRGAPPAQDPRARTDAAARPGDRDAPDHDEQQHDLEGTGRSASRAPRARSRRGRACTLSRATQMMTSAPRMHSVPASAAMRSITVGTAYFGGDGAQRPARAAARRPRSRPRRPRR